MSRGIIAFLAGIMLTVPTGAGALEAPRQFRTDYSITLFGVSVAKAAFISTFNGTDFSIEGDVKSAGVARLFDDTNAHTRVSGHLDDAIAAPNSYALNYTYGGKAKKTLLGFAGGAVASTQNEPPLGNRRPSWVPVSEDDLKSVTDPLTAAVIRADGPQQVCARTLRVFDGEIRADLQLSYAGTKPFRTRGFAGDAVRCSARFVPVSGYHKDRKAIDFLANEAEIEIAFAPFGNTGVYAPVTASVSTQVGTIYVRAKRFGVMN